MMMNCRDTVTPGKWPSMILRLAIERQKGLGESTNLPRVFHGSPPTNDWSAFINVVVGGGRKNPNQSPT